MDKDPSPYLIAAMVVFAPLAAIFLILAALALA